MEGYVKQFETINFSTAKQKYSFSKGARFPSVAKKHTDSIGYDLPSTKTKRTTGFGHGKRFQTPMQQRQDSPPPGSYTLMSEFDIGKPGTAINSKKAGLYSFGISHDFYKKVYLP